MATEKWVALLNAKLDALLKAQGIDMKQFDEAAAMQTAAPARELTPQEQQAIDNAPKAEATVPPDPRGPRITPMNAPDTSSSMPPAEVKGADDADDAAGKEGQRAVPRPRK